ncbi:MAG: AzlC family ABC transporter permease [Solobacterium sp.]|nr:AzlC family ABC transporter permease [Solobacterium sp.]
MDFKSPELKTAFHDSIPVMTGYVFLGMAYGVYMNVNGFSWVYPVSMAMIIFGGSLEFVAVTMLMSRFAPLQTFLMAFMIQARHLFYGLAMLEKYKGLRRRPYLIFALSDETFAVGGSKTLPEHLDPSSYYFYLSAMDQFYWIFGAFCGGMFGSFIPFNTEGLDFVMTTMFVVIFLDAVLKEKTHLPSLIGLLASLGCLMVFGADNFIIPSMCVILVFLILLRSKISASGGFQ